MGVRSVGVEEEFLLARAHGVDLAARGDAVVDAASAADADAQFEHELKAAQAELASDPTTSLAELGRNLQTLRGVLAAASRRHGVRLVASGTSPVRTAVRTTATDRYQDMTEQFGLLARDQLTCGMHVHVAVDDPDQATAALTGIAPWLPVLLALSANSPFYGGSDSGYASYRTVLWGRWPTAGPTGSFGDRAEYDALRRDLIATGAARDDGMIYFDARLSVDYPTVEIRVCDVCVEVGDAVLIAALARGLVTAALQAEPAPPVRPELLRAATWRAARWGMAGELVAFGTGRPRLLPAWDLIGELRDLVGPALEEAGDADRVDAALRAVQDRGTGADRQRQAYAGDGGFEAVVQAVTVAPG